ncbi:MAG: saccharopine dehydrogenase NADP-binding domain-containing protein [Planctomycetaceae bacterium]|nr:saccharopine dehydrogenase NADP-binding domain-containing protein [Planctomycetaceae bacterium]
MIRKVLLLGAGKIGRMIARLLVDSGDYDLLVADASPEALQRLVQRVAVNVQPLDVEDAAALQAVCNGQDVVICALSFRFSERVARAALQAGASYFDLTEDVATTRAIEQLSVDAGTRQIFMPQCGLAPGFISIVAAHLLPEFDQVDSVRMRVGALPTYPTNMLKYNLTWSTDGLINEYCNLCEVIHDGARMDVLPLEGLEEFSLDGVRYEAFHTSGGLGTLCQTLEHRVRDLNYKTIRYPGHRELMHFLLGELRFRQRRDLLREILEQSIPVTFQDVVITFCTVTGQRRGQLVQLTDARKVYSESIDGEAWSAIQITTAASLCAVLDLHTAGRLPQTGFVRQEQVSLSEFLANRFGRYYNVAPTLQLYQVPEAPSGSASVPG